jgi:GT2 family glycosyltransferase
MESVTVLVASYCGEKTLPRLFDALARQSLGDIRVQFVLVDNASSDATSDLMRKFLEDRAGTTLIEPKAGKSHALNAGLAHATGELILFTDDDTIPDVDWIATYVEFFRANPSANIATGQIRSVWPLEPPHWLAELDRYGRTLGATPVERKTGPVPASEAKGANLAIRSTALPRKRPFRPELGVSSQGVLLAGEETALAEELSASGSPSHYVAEAKVGHVIRQHQMSLRYVLARARRNGRGVALASPPIMSSRYMLFGIPFYALMSAANGLLRGHLTYAFGNRYEAAMQLITTHELIGFLQMQKHVGR